MPNATPTFWLIAGPNGVGKTTYAFRYLKSLTGSINFINMDEIARGLSPLDPSVAEQDAARIALLRANTMIADRQTFAMETTMSGQAHLRLLEAAQQGGLHAHLMYFSARTPEICLTRIARRVAEGGHDVPEPVVRRRFARSLNNLPAYTGICDLWRIYDASVAKPCLALEGQGRTLTHADTDCLAGAHQALKTFSDRF